MATPEKIKVCEVALPTFERWPFPSVIEIFDGHKIADGAILNVLKLECIDRKKVYYRWTSAPIDVRRDIITVPTRRLTFLKVMLTLKIDSTDEPCDPNKPPVTSPGPGDVIVTITNDPTGPVPEPSDPEVVDPIYFP